MVPECANLPQIEVMHRSLSSRQEENNRVEVLILEDSKIKEVNFAEVHAAAAGQPHSFLLVRVFS